MNLEIFLDENINGDWRHHSKWERPKARILHNPFGESQRAKVTAVQWSPDGKMLGLASDEGSAKVFLHENYQLKVYQGHSSHKESSKEVYNNYFVFRQNDDQHLYYSFPFFRNSKLTPFAGPIIRLW